MRALRIFGTRRVNEKSSIFERGKDMDNSSSLTGSEEERSACSRTVEQLL